ncbi:unnamed protein product [Adineta ricciae]|uniref:Carrier domain-containing protein n=1 Tax=Adineta ricciae TaxID=249248 RepID=A0A815NUG6_ADIRI|nr:unnamed protein product [Adineta ricciae]
MLSIVTCGGIYCPLSFYDSENDLHLLLQNIQSHLVLVHCLTKTKFDGNIISLDIGSILTNTITENNTNIDTFLDVVLTPKNIAYTISTSGSADVPKLVEIQHYNFIGYIRSLICMNILTNKDTVLQMSCASNSIHIQEIIGTLIVGSAVIMLHPRGNKDVTYISNVLQQKQVSCMQTIPERFDSVLKFLLEYDCIKFNTLRNINIRNITSTIQSIKELCSNLFNNVHIWNSYSSTETMVDFLYHLIDLNDKKSIFSIGYPFSNYKCIILDKYLQPITIGQIGELFVGSVDIFTAYLERNDLTTKVFIDIDNEVFYRTGDLVRRDNRGLLYYKGKKNRQTKFHGHDVDLNEIEQCLLEHISISASIVIILDDSCLTAYVQSSGIDENQLREYCESRLSYHMVPSVFVILEQLPLNENGKVDRELLPTPSLSAITNADQSDSMLLTPLEKDLQCIFSEVFDDELPNLNMSFTEMGGTSLNVLHMIYLIRQQLGIEIDATLVFNYPSIRQLAQVVKPLLSLDDESSIISKTSAAPVDLPVSL